MTGRLEIDDLLALQGFRRAWLSCKTEVLSDAKLGHMCGNAMSVNVLASVMSAALDCTGL